MKILFTICGGARTFLKTFDNIHEHFINPFSENSEICHVYYYLKNFDPGPKGQDNWNFSYKSIDSNSLIEKIKSKNFFNYDIIESDIPDDEIIKLIGKREIFTGFYNTPSSNGTDNLENPYKHLARGMQMFINYANVYEKILQFESIHGFEYDFICFLRPDLLFYNKFQNFTNYSREHITINHSFHMDHCAIIPRRFIEHYLLNPLKVYKFSTGGSFVDNESVLRHCISNLPMLRNNINYSICREDTTQNIQLY